METKKVKVRVRSAVLKTFWYSKFIGKVFEVNRSTQFKDRYELVLDGERLRSFIREEDCELINDTNEK